MLQHPLGNLQWPKAKKFFLKIKIRESLQNLIYHFSSAQEPKARKRITAPNDYEDEPDRKYSAVSTSGDSSIKSRLGTRQRISF